MVRRGTLHALLSVGHETISACVSCKTPQILLETLELCSLGFILAFNTAAQETQVCKLAISNAS